MGRAGHDQDEEEGRHKGRDQADVWQVGESGGETREDRREGLLREGPEGQHLRCSCASLCTNVWTGGDKWRHQLQVWGFPHLLSAGAPELRPILATDEGCN